MSVPPGYNQVSGTNCVYKNDQGAMFVHNPSTDTTSAWYIPKQSEELYTPPRSNSDNSWSTVSLGSHDSQESSNPFYIDATVAKWCCIGILVAVPTVLITGLVVATFLVVCL